MTDPCAQPAGLLKHDPFITFPNTCGVVLAMYATLTAYGLADEKASLCPPSAHLSALPSSSPASAHLPYAPHSAAPPQTKNSLRTILCAEAVILPLLGVITVFGCADLSQQQALWCARPPSLQPFSSPSKPTSPFLISPFTPMFPSISQ